MRLIHSPGRRAGKTSECEKHCDYWYRVKMSDGQWTIWVKCTVTDFATIRSFSPETCKGFETRVTKKGETP